MPIYKKDQLFYIHSKDMSIILEEREGYLFLKHIGKRINQYNHSNAVIEKDHSFSANPTQNDRTFSLDTLRQVVGVTGLGDTRQPSIQIEHSNNELLQFKYKDYEIISGIEESKKLPNPYTSDEEAETLIIYLEDEIAKVGLKLFYTVYSDSNTITTFSEVINLGDENIKLHEAMSVMLDLPKQEYKVKSFQGAYAREKTVKEIKLEQGIFQVSSNRGASGHSHTPSIILSDLETSEDYGNALSVQLMYSGNFKIKVQQSQLGEVRVLAGINSEKFAWGLESQESFNTPVAVMNFSDKGFTGLTQESQFFVQNHIIPGRFSNKIRPILINNWEATYFDFTKSKLLELAKTAKETGIELFVLDDGWFGDRRDDFRALGDWNVNEEKLNGSLKELITEVKDLGLQFGLWVEPEMISEESNLYREHPEWVIQAPGRKHTYSRSQLVLDLSNKEVVKYIKETLDYILANHDIDYIKWDMNRNITNIGNGSSYIETMQQSHEYMLNLYEITEYITNKYPSVLFESCSGGGGRNDLGMMRYFPQVWASDNTDAIDRLAIQYGSSYLYPTISMGAHVSVAPNHQVNRSTPLETRGDVAMMGNLGYELDLTSLSSKEIDSVKEQIARYKTIRHTVQLGKQYRLINPGLSSNETAVQFVKDGQVVVTYVRILSMIEQMETTIKLKGLEPDGFYQLNDNQTIYSGAELMYGGFTIDLPAGDFLSKQLIFNKIKN